MFQKRSKVLVILIELGHINFFMLSCEFKGSQHNCTARRNINRQAVASVVLDVTFVHSVPLTVAAIQSLETTVLVLIGFVQYHVGRVPIRSDEVVLVGIAGVKVENEN